MSEYGEYSVSSMKTMRGILWYVWQGNTELHRSPSETVARMHAQRLAKKAAAPAASAPPVPVASSTPARRVCAKRGCPETATVRAATAHTCLEHYDDFAD